MRAITEFLAGSAGGQIRTIPAVIGIFFRYWKK
jgi:hypothetical protein